jgi:hypothetical protein
MDPQNHALDVFDVWLALYPSEEDRIAKAILFADRKEEA